MLHSKSQGHWRFGSKEEDIQIVFTIYRCGGHHSHVTISICTNFDLPIIRRRHMKFEFNWPSGF